MISNDEIDHVMALARLRLEDDKKKQLVQELGAILDYVTECEKAPTGNIQTIEQISGLKNISRPDEITSSLSIEKVLQNAPESASWRKNNFIKIKQVF